MVSKEMAITRQSPAPVALLEKGWGCPYKALRESADARSDVHAKEEHSHLARICSTRGCGPQLSAGMAGVAAANQTSKALTVHSATTDALVPLEYLPLSRNFSI